MCRSVWRKTQSCVIIIGRDGMCKDIFLCKRDTKKLSSKRTNSHIIKANKDRIQTEYYLHFSFDALALVGLLASSTSLDLVIGLLTGLPVW